MMATPYLAGIKKAALIPSHASRKILEAISHCDFNASELREYKISAHTLTALHREFKITQANLEPAQALQPKHLAFYFMLKKRIPQLAWEVIERHQGNPIVNFKLPIIDKLQPSLASLLLGRAEYLGDNRLYATCPETATLAHKGILDALNTFLTNIEAIYPQANMAPQILDWILRAKQGERSTIFLHTCPDYSVEPTGNPSCPYKHNFESLGNKMGQISRRLLDALPHIQMLCTQLKIMPQIVVTIADYEAFSAATCRRVKETKASFLKKVQQSLSCFQKASLLPNLKTHMLTQLFLGETAWLKAVANRYIQLASGQFGHAPIKPNTFTDIAKARMSLYSRWYGNGKGIECYRDIALSQAAEYSVIGCQISRMFDNCLVLGADSELFGPFYSIERPIPTLYLKRKYC